MTGCAGTKLLAVPTDPAARGPWAVGVRTVTLDGVVTEVWYPATPGSDAGKTAARYDLRDTLPAAERKKIPDTDQPWLTCDCVRDLPLDEAHGPYPVLWFMHGYTLGRAQSVSLVAHWASRGFVVLSSDYPGTTLADVMSGSRKFKKPAGPARTALAALPAFAGDLAFLAGHADLSRLGLAGFSMGGEGVTTIADGTNAQVVVDMADKYAAKPRRDAAGAETPYSLVYFAARDDGFEKYDGIINTFAQVPHPRRLVVIHGAGHLAFCDLCTVAEGQGGFMGLAAARGVPMRGFIKRLTETGCQELTIPMPRIQQVVKYVTAAAFEEKLMCSTTATAALTDVRTAQPDVGEYRDEP